MYAILRSLLMLSLLAGLALQGSAAEILAVEQAGADDTEKLQNAIDAASPGDTIYLGDCARKRGRVRCHTPRVWTVARLAGKNGVHYRGGTETGARSTLRLMGLSPEDDWDSARWRDILSFSGQPRSDQPTIFRNIIFDGNRDGQGASPNPNCAKPCGSDLQCVGDWCVPKSCGGCRDPQNCPAKASCKPAPRQEGLHLTASDGEQFFEVDGCELRNHLWVGLLVWHNANVVASAVETSNNHNAIHLGGHDGLVTLELADWTSVGDRVPFRGEVEGPLEVGRDVVRGRITSSEIVDPGGPAILFSTKQHGIKSQLVVDGVTARCDQVKDCGAYLHLVPRSATVEVRNTRVGSGSFSGYDGLSVWLQQVSGDVTVADSKLGGYVHFHSVGPGFDDRVDRVLFKDLFMSGSGRTAGRYRIPGSPRIDYAFYLNRNLNVRGNSRLLALEGVDVREMRVKSLLHLYGGIASVDRATLTRNRLGIALGGDRALYTSTLRFERAPGDWQTVVEEDEFQFFSP